MDFCISEPYFLVLNWTFVFDPPTQVRQHYSAMLETIELFNTKLARDFQRIEEAQDKMARP